MSFILVDHGIMEIKLHNNKNIAEGTRGPFYTIGRSSLPTADTLRRRRRKKNLNPKAQHRETVPVSQYFISKTPASNEAKSLHGAVRQLCGQ